MILDATCQLDYHTMEEVPAIFMMRPRSGWAQWIMREEFQIARRCQWWNSRMFTAISASEWSCRWAIFISPCNIEFKCQTSWMRIFLLRS